MRRSIDATVENHLKVGAPPTWVLSNHDVIRHATRFAPTPDGRAVAKPMPVDPERGLRRARAATVFMLGLPGSAYLYQGEELGLPEVFDLPDDARQDPVWIRSQGTDTGRDGCRVPIPWQSTAPSYGFGPSPHTWLPQPDSWAELAVDVQAEVESSTLSLYRRALERRHMEDSLGHGPMTWLDDAPEGVLALRRFTEDTGHPGVLVVINISDDVVHLPSVWGDELLLESSDDVAVVTTENGPHVVLGAETAVWLRS
jgi:alpha-glucosidase